MAGTISIYRHLFLATAVCVGLVTALPGTAGCREISQKEEEVRDSVRNASLEADISAFKIALEQYAVDHDDAYPAPDVAVNVLTQNGYLLNNRMPLNPWDEHVSVGLISSKRFSDNLKTGAAIAKVAHTPPAGTLLGVGHLPGAGSGNLLVYGNLVYDYDKTSKTYVVYGIGKRGSQAIVVRAPSPGETAKTHP